MVTGSPILAGLDHCADPSQSCELYGFSVSENSKNKKNRPWALPEIESDQEKVNLTGEKSHRYPVFPLLST
ncbi:MAG: hypothetical protein KJ808_00480 [Acidobacteria bacterium]|nr:hypothetical protein [Acidobacteriota bacterium]MBU4308068.1 hypothetical protein [Acidobacteriota bacterium]MCG2810094.1 hypothetical protein [Candidatus Aminicenantes bacterium]